MTQQRGEARGDKAGCLGCARTGRPQTSKPRPAILQLGSKRPSVLDRRSAPSPPAPLVHAGIAWASERAQEHALPPHLPRKKSLDPEELRWLTVPQRQAVPAAHLSSKSKWAPRHADRHHWSIRVPSAGPARPAITAGAPSRRFFGGAAPCAPPSFAAPARHQPPLAVTVAHSPFHPSHSLASRCVGSQSH